jgi:Mrp family chromosome partitioning ATPase
MDRLDHSIRDARSANKAFDTPVLSAIPATLRSHQFELAAPGTKHDAAYRALAATSIATDKLPRAIVVTSPTGEVQDGVAANFAAALAGLGLKVALVPTQDRHDWFLGLADLQVPDDLPDVLALARAGQLNGQVSENLIPTGTPNLWVLASGAAGDDALLEGMPTLLTSLSSADIDVTVIAGPALLEDPAATILAWSTRSVLWVVESGSVTETEAHEASNRLELAGASAFGVTLVEAKT